MTTSHHPTPAATPNPAPFCRGDFPRTGVALVIGGSGAIGSQISLGLAAAGCDVALTYHRNEQRAQDVARQITALGQRAQIAPLELKDADAVKLHVDATAERFGGIHSIVYASGPEIRMAPIDQLTPADWAAVMQTDVMGAFNLVWAGLPHLKASQGSLVAVVTAAVDRVPPKDILSASPKVAIEMLIKGVAKEQGRAGIRANCVGPGWVDDGLGREVMQTQLDESTVERMRRAIPLRRFGEAREIAQAVVFLASQRASFITGQTLCVDGGGSL